MNYLTISSSPTNSTQNPWLLARYNQHVQTNNIIQFISLALSTDFARFARHINAKIIQEVRNPQSVHPVKEPERPRANSLPVLKEKAVKAPASRTVQKPQASKGVSVPKKLKPKNTPAPVSSTSTAPPPEKKEKKPLPEKLPSSKLKKKIHKNVEVKKENPGRVPQVSMIETAELGTCLLGEREKRKLKERLLLRQVREWRQTEEPKRDRRDLRALQ